MIKRWKLLPISSEFDGLRMILSGVVRRHVIIANYNTLQQPPMQQQATAYDDIYRGALTWRNSMRKIG